jgi:ring-1,2-phenylacetyl-CoA epoxidase subunit PaaC
VSECSDQRLAEIAVKAAKEIRYHLRYGSQWLIRLGDGTGESQRRAQGSLDELWKFTGELFAGDATDEAIRAEFAGPDLDKLKIAWAHDIAAIVDEATLVLPGDQWMASGGREGRHSEAFGFLIAEMQHLQRAYPGLNW